MNQEFEYDAVHSSIKILHCVQLVAHVTIFPQAAILQALLRKSEFEKARLVIES